MADGKPFDELWGNSRSRKARAGFEPLARWLSDTPAAELDRRQQAAETAFRSLGITFSVYGEEEAAERIIPFDIIPRIFAAAEWERLSAGLEQRVRAINAFIDDVYGARKILERRRSSRPTSSSTTRNSASPAPAPGRRTASTPIFAGSTWSAPAPTNSSCSRTMPAPRRASPT